MGPYHPRTRATLKVQNVFSEVLQFKRSEPPPKAFQRKIMLLPDEESHVLGTRRKS